MVSNRKRKKPDRGEVLIATYKEAKKPVDTGIYKHKACKMMSDAGLKRSSFYRYLQKLKDSSDSSSVTVSYIRDGQPVDGDPPVDLCMPGSRSRTDLAFA